MSVGCSLYVERGSEPASRAGDEPRLLGKAISPSTENIVCTGTSSTWAPVRTVLLNLVKSLNKKPASEIRTSCVDNGFTSTGTDPDPARRRMPPRHAARPRRAGENFKLMPLAGPSMPCFNECAIDPYHHLLSWFVENLRVIDFLADDRFPRGSLLQCVCRQRAFGCVLWHD
jgi:hypothetical protein